LTRQTFLGDNAPSLAIIHRWFVAEFISMK